MHSARILFYLFFSLSTCICFAQENFFQNTHSVYDSETGSIAIEDILVFRDDSNKLLISDIQALKPSEFLRLEDITLFNKTSTYWGFFQLVSRTNTNLDFIIAGGRNARETYYLINGERQEVKQTGYLFPSNQREIRQGYPTRVRLNLPGRATLKVFVKVESTDNNPIDIQATLIPEAEWAEDFKSLNLFEGIFSGVLIIIIALAFFIYGFTGERVFLHFALYALANVVYFLQIHGIIELYVWPNAIDPVPSLWLLPLLSASAYFTFARYFLDTENEFPRWDKVLKVLTYVAFASFIVLSVFLYLTKDMYNGVMAMHICMIVLLTITAVFVLIAGRGKSIIAKYFAYGTALLVASVFIAIISQLNAPSNDLPVLVQAGILLEIVIFSLGISHKLKRQFEDHDITQRSLILQLRKNEKLQWDINQELEEIVADRTQQINRQNKALNKARKEAEKATRAKSDFLSVMSHEIRTPLNAIISLSHIMELDNKDEEMKEYIHALKFSAESLHSLINDILDYNKIEAGKLRLESIEFSLIDLLKNLAESFKYKANSKGIEMRIEIGEHLPDRLSGDPTRLTQILNNLIGNAIKFTHEGYVHIKASLKGIKDDQATVSFSVKDTGIGIPEDKLQLIFEEYEQASDQTTREYGGTGLGLSIVKKLLSMMGTGIEVFSAENDGTTFFFDINFKIDPEFDLIDLQQDDRDKDLSKKQILVVDDNHMNRLVLKRLLQIWNGDFDESDDGGAAISKCLNKKYDIVLMDLEMRPVHGFAAATEIHKSGINKDTPIIAMSAHSPADYEIEYREAGFVDFVHKPFDPEELFQKLSSQLQKK